MNINNNERMSKMKEILLNKKWVGAAVLLLYVLAVSAFFTNFGVKFVKQAAPMVERELVDFLPITIADGEIIEPKDTVITKTFGQGNDENKVVLDTRVDEFETSELKNKGLYVSRKYIYLVSNLKTEIRDMKEFPNMVIDEEVLHDVADLLTEKAGKYIFLGVFIMFWIFAAAAIGLYTLAMHWALAGLFHNPFAQTLRINTFAYIAVSVLTMIAGFNIGIIATFVILGAVNYAVNKWLQEEKKA